MKKTLLLALAVPALMAVPMIASAAQGIIGDCSDCHTMHNSEQGQHVAQKYDPATGTYEEAVAEPIMNLLRMDCIACHANPDATGPTYTLAGGSVVPQVSQSTDDNLAGGNFRYSTEDQRKGHNVIDLTPADDSNAGTVGSPEYGAPPGNAHGSHHGMNAGVFSVNEAFDAFTCAGARGCHGTRSQLLSGTTVSNAQGNFLTNAVRRTGIAAISGAHHNSFDGAKTSDGYTAGEHKHNGAVVAAGYRFIPGLKAYGNEAARWKNVDASSHNEYYAFQTNALGEAAGCGDCHQEGTTGETATGTPAMGLGSRAALTSYMKVPKGDISGFCGTCHGVFHSAGTENGTSGAFLRHPSDWVIPESGEYAAYDVYDITAPVARPTVKTAASSVVAGGTDMVMCLSCHQAHATANDYMLRFDYNADMTAGAYGSIAAATGKGGCLACHTTKGVLPGNR